MLVNQIDGCRDQLSAEHAEVIKATLPLVGANIENITRLFYQTMFEKHPELIKNVFNRGNQKQGAQQKALAASVATFASMLVNKDAPLPDQLLSRIGHKHVSLGVTEDQYQIVHDNLFYAIVQILGADVVTKDVAQAWNSVYWIMARLLINFEKDLYKGAKVEPGKVFRKTTVVERESLTNDVARFTIESKDGSQPLPAHLPGQYISVRAQLPDGAGQLRQYSLIDSGKKAGGLSFAVKSLQASESAPAGEVSNWILENVQVGTDLEVSLPFGDLVLNTESNAPVVLISAGIGATPMVGILSRLSTDASERRVVIIHADTSANTDAFAAQRDHLTAALKNCESHIFYKEGAPGKDVTIGQLDVSKFSFPNDAELYLCGSTTFLQEAREGLKVNNVKSSSVHFEMFAPNDWLLDE
ncbi:hypothetical protein MCAP1_002950 [Malassezia caprae]|uniref:nitric oxide dioxygenase n=1 Tax=Malassezia caprae TaxID=1381934 RepID=A0AAF0E7U6_9BASI|nr:hypothetical protein MCAP1_002950 [Malassezia caprae]